jgi:hypothetical protein
MKVTNVRKAAVTILDKKGKHQTIQSGKTVEIDIPKNHPFLAAGYLCAKAHLTEIPASLQIDAKELQSLRDQVASLKAENQEQASLIESLKLEIATSADQQSNKG